MTALLYLGAASLLLLVFGAGPARALLARDGSLPGMLGLAYGLGALLLTVEGLFFSAAGLRWSVFGLAAPLVLLSLFSMWRAAGRGTDRPSVGPPSIPSILLVTLAAGVLGVGLLNSSANSVDFVLIYGPKAVWFAAFRSISPEVLSYRFFAHAAPRYPPLMPIVESWGVIVAGEMPWRFGTAISFVWYVASVAVIGSRLRARLGGSFGAAATAYWASAMALSFVFSLSGGNGEAPLVYFVSTAAVFLLTEGPRESRLVPAALLAGAAMSKQEGLLAALALVAGTILRDLLQRRPRALVRGALAAGLPVGAVLLWFGFERLTGLPVGYRPPGPFLQPDIRVLPDILPDLLRNLNAGTHGLSWIVPVLLLARRPAKRIVDVLPALVLSAALSAALLATYLAPVSIDRSDVIGRTLPRACQPILSLLILAAAVRSERTESAGPAGATSPDHRPALG